MLGPGSEVMLELGVELELELLKAEPSIPREGAEAFRLGGIAWVGTESASTRRKGAHGE